MLRRCRCSRMTKLLSIIDSISPACKCDVGKRVASTCVTSTCCRVKKAGDNTSNSLRSITYIFHGVRCLNVPSRYFEQNGLSCQ